MTTEPALDPRFCEKVRHVAGLYLASPEAAVVLCAEKSSQSRARTASALLLEPPRLQRRSGGPSSLRAALEIGSRKVLRVRTGQQRAIEFTSLLHEIDCSVPGGLDVHVIVNNASTHKTPGTEDWIARHPRFALHFTPTRSSWLDLADRWITEMAGGSGRAGLIEELETAIRSWVVWWNEDPRPFVWTYRTDEISAKGRMRG